MAEFNQFYHQNHHHHSNVPFHHMPDMRPMNGIDNGPPSLPSVHTFRRMSPGRNNGFTQNGHTEHHQRQQEQQQQSLPLQQQHPNHPHQHLPPTGVHENQQHTHFPAPLQAQQRRNQVILHSHRENKPQSYPQSLSHHHDHLIGLPHHSSPQPPPQAHPSWRNLNQRLSISSQSEYRSSRMTHGSNNSDIYQHNSMDESEMMMDESEYGSYPMYQDPEEDEMVEGMMSASPRAVHQCNVCNKIFVSFKGLQQHAVIHTDQKPFRCDICSKAFRFKSNLFEHRSVHTGFTPHACPYCGKTCRLKGNLKKHLRTHVTTKEELEAAWRPFASNRRPAAEIPDDAIIVRGAAGPYYQTPPRPKKKKLGLGDTDTWLGKLRSGEILPQVELEDKIRRLEDTIFNNMSLDRWASLIDMAKSIAFETHDCPSCKVAFMTRSDCINHNDIEHANENNGFDFFCEKCYRPFADDASFRQHMSYHTRVQDMFDTGTLNRSEPDVLIPTHEEFTMLFDGLLPVQILE